MVNNLQVLQNMARLASYQLDERESMCIIVVCHVLVIDNPCVKLLALYNSFWPYGLCSLIHCCPMPCLASRYVNHYVLFESRKLLIYYLSIV